MWPITSTPFTTTGGAENWTPQGSSGAGFVAAVGRVGGILAPYATGALLPLWGPGGVLALHGGLLLLAGVFAFAVRVETRGKPLEEA